MDIFGIGTVVVDHVLRLQDLPERDHKRQIDHHWFQVGGPVPTALVMAARLGRSTSFMGKWGDDHHGGLIEFDLTREGVNIEASRREPGGRTGFAHIWTEPEGTRTIAYSRGDFDPPGPADLPEEALATCRILHLDGWSGDAAVQAAKTIRARGGTVVLDGGSMKPGMEALLPLVHVLVASRQFVRDAGSEDFQGPSTVIRTLGADGTSCRHEGSSFATRAFPVDAVDSNGAGDVFSGALLHGLLEDWPMTECVRFASAAAALKCRAEGNRDALPSGEDIARLIG